MSARRSLRCAASNVRVDVVVGREPALIETAPHLSRFTFCTAEGAERQMRCGSVVGQVHELQAVMSSSSDLFFSAYPGGPKR